MVKNLLKVIYVLEGLQKSRTPENVEHVWTSINKYQQLTVQELEAGLGIP